jgi:hypothetical protein
MEPGAIMLQPMGGVRDIRAADREPEFVRSLWTLNPSPTAFLERATEERRIKTPRFAPRLARNGPPVTLTFVGKLFEVSEPVWTFVCDVMVPDPEKRPTAEQPLKHSWLRT